MEDFARRELADYYGCCTGLDAEMGRLLAALEDLDLADDTIVCYSSDHGDHLSSHGYGKPGDSWLHHSMSASKATPYDESAHVHFLIRWPGGTPPGSRSSKFMGAIDIVPSLISACSVTAPGGKESAYLMNMANGWPNRTHWMGRWRGVRTENYTYARWFDNERGP
jgi:arylsulfatase A-like enzyme